MSVPPLPIVELGIAGGNPCPGCHRWTIYTLELCGHYVTTCRCHLHITQRTFQLAYVQTAQLVNRPCLN